MGRRRESASRGDPSTSAERRASSRTTQPNHCRPCRWRNKRLTPSGAAGCGLHAGRGSGTIYLNRDWLRTATEEAALAVLTEEFGHHLDALFNAVDTPGDEGSLFSQLLINREQAPLSHNEAEDDHGLINVNGETLQAEFAATSDLTLVFEDGAIGTIGQNPQKNNNVQLFSTLGIERIIFVQDDSDGNGEFGQQSSSIVQGNDIPGTVKITTYNGNVYSISGAVVWNDKVGGTPVSFGILLGEDKTIVSSTGTYNLVSGDTNNSSSNISINAVGASPGYADGDNISGSADRSNILSEFNQYLEDSIQVSTISSSDITEGENLVFSITLEGAVPAGTTYVYDITATETLRGATFSNGVSYNSADSTVSVPAGVSSFTVTFSTTDDSTPEATQSATLSVGNIKDTASIFDNDSPGVTIAQTGSTSGADLLTTEAGSSSTFTVVLDAQPNADVTVSITGLDTSENSLSGSTLSSSNTLTFTAANWNTPQSITITGVDDTLVDGDITTTLTATASNTGGYAGTETATTTVKNTDDDSYGITIAQTGSTSGSDLLTTEAGSSSTFTVVLDAQPTADVTVSITGLDPTENSLSTNTLTFTAANWNTPQSITVTGVDDTLVDGDITTTLTATASNTGGYAGTESATIDVVSQDTAADADNDGADDSFEGSNDPLTNAPYDRNGDGIPDVQQRTVATVEAGNGAPITIAARQEVQDNFFAAEGNGSLRSQTTLLFEGINGTPESRGGIDTPFSATPALIQALEQAIQTNPNNQGLPENATLILQTSVQPSFRLTPEIIKTGLVSEDAEAAFRETTTQAFSSRIQQVDLYFDNGAWNSLFKPNGQGGYFFFGFNPDTGLGGVLVDRNEDGSIDGATIYLQDNKLGDLDPNPGVILDPIGLSQAAAPPTLKRTNTGDGFTVEGIDGTGLWVQFKTTTAAANWQNSLNLHSSIRTSIRSIGATSQSNNLGFVELFVVTGETITFSQHSNLANTNTTPSLRTTASDAGYILALNDNSVDNDFNDLIIEVTSSLNPVQAENIPLTRQQTSNAAAIYDFSSITSSGLAIELTVASDCAFANQLAFVALDVDSLTGLPYGDYRIDGIGPADHATYKAKVLNNLVQPGGQAIVATGRQTQVINWTLSPEEQGFYAPVLITPKNEVFTAGLLSARDGQQHAKLLGQNFVGFEDLLASQRSDWDFNDVTVLANVLT